MSRPPSSRFPFDWKPLAGRALEATLNRALALDPETRDGLRPLDGRSVVLSLDPPGEEGAPLALRLTVAQDRLNVGPVDVEATPDLAVRGTFAGALSFGMQTLLPKLLGGRDDDKDDAVPVGRMRIEGDADLARRLQRLAERFDPDWRQPFAAVFGDVIGVQIANGVAAALKQARAGGRSFAESTAEYLTEESRDVVPRAELDAFYDDVDALRDDVARLAARVARLGGRVTA
ncbi:MAG: SCP2 sterol-binding domain-containing protein [Xanthomonadaceae bacterium]|nr:SCP2 sterol-binding domain-containing protein [Xanthomonadaceae bacterium]